MFLCIHIVSSEYCASYWSYVLLLVLMMSRGDRVGSSRSHGPMLCEGVQEWADSCNQARGCLEVLEERWSAIYKHLMVLEAYI